MSKQIPLGEYIFRRLNSLGIQHVLGVPGDFNLHLLDHLSNVDGLKWVGCCNELNAAYAADGYTRIRNVPAALVTTYGVGELSAINGVAGAYAEHAGMIHIVGMTSRQVQKARPVLHHTLEPGMDQSTYVRMSEPIRYTHAVLDNESTLTDEVDRVIRAGFQSRLPVYLFVPMDLAGYSVDAAPLGKPLECAVKNEKPELEDEVVAAILSAIQSKSDVALLADVLCIRHGGQEVVQELAEVTQFPSFACPLSKGIIDEDKPYYEGVYAGNLSFPGIKERLEGSDLVINVAPLLSDSNTGGYTRQIQEDRLVLLAHDRCEVLGKVWPGFHFLPILQKLLVALKKDLQSYKLPQKRVQPAQQTPTLRSDTNGPLRQDYVWQRVGRYLRSGDIVLTDCGTAQFGMFDAVFPPGVAMITSVFWSSIGFAVGACLGACVAAREQQRQGRVILIVGDGSLQMTVQEISTMIRHGFKPTIFIVNNDGYSIERAIHGPKMGYNDINTDWDYQFLLSFFGARQENQVESASVKCASVEELEGVLNDDSFARQDRIQLCELVFSKFDYPWRLATQIEHVLGQPLECRDYENPEILRSIK